MVVGGNHPAFDVVNQVDQGHTVGDAGVSRQSCVVPSWKGA